MNAPGPDIDAEYRQLREECGLLRQNASFLTVEGPDAAEYLHSQVTNDIETLEAGEGRYCCLLDRKGHIQADMRILRTGEQSFRIVCEPGATASLEKHLVTYSIGRDVRISPGDETLVSLIGPATFTVTGVAPGDEHDSVPSRIDGIDCLMVATPTGVDVIAPAEAADRIVGELLEAGSEEVSEAAVEILRVESGRPRFERELSGGPMPAEAGLVERAVSFTKGCYIGQEPVARLHYKGRPNRMLRGLKLVGRVGAGDLVRSAERELGTIDSVALSPVEGWIGLSILRREAEVGHTVEVVTGDGVVEAKVTELPFPAALAELV
jgi:folate-binding protein YgfZ